MGLMDPFKQLMTLTLITLSSFHCISLTFKKLLQGLSNLFAKYKTNNHLKNVPMEPYKWEGGRFENLNRSLQWEWGLTL
jgi:hypothetical protein